MKFPFWPAQSKVPAPPPLVVPHASPADQARIDSLAKSLGLKTQTSLPDSGDCIVVAATPGPAIAGIAPHIPVVFLSEPDLEGQLRKAILYLEAHQRISR